MHAPFLPGRPGDPALAVVEVVGQAFQPDRQPGKADLQPLSFLTIDLRLLQTSDEIVKAIREAIADPITPGKVRSYSMALPHEIAQRTGFIHESNVLMVPVDRRLEEFARRLVQSPGDFLAKKDADPLHLLRLEGVKTLRLFPSERNVAVVRTWLDDPLSTQPFKADQKTQSPGLVPAIPKDHLLERKVALPVKLADVPEIHFQQPLTKAMKTADAQLHTAVTIDGVNLMNQKKTDGFIEALMSKRPELAGLAFAMGDSCRMKEDASRKFATALDVFRQVDGSPCTVVSPKDSAAEKRGWKYYQELSTEKKIDLSASVASLMQVLGHEDGNTSGSDW